MWFAYRPYVSQAQRKREAQKHAEKTEEEGACLLSGGA